MKLFVHLAEIYVFYTSIFTLGVVERDMRRELDSDGYEELEMVVRNGAVLVLLPRK
jgi:hypothetical protein